jgi:hypothetical protein
MLEISTNLFLENTEDISIDNIKSVVKDKLETMQVRKRWYKLWEINITSLSVDTSRKFLRKTLIIRNRFIESGYTELIEIWKMSHDKVIDMVMEKRFQLYNSDILHQSHEKQEQETRDFWKVKKWLDQDRSLIRNRQGVDSDEEEEEEEEREMQDESFTQVENVAHLPTQQEEDDDTSVDSEVTPKHITQNDLEGDDSDSDEDELYETESTNDENKKPKYDHNQNFQQS